MRHCLRPERAFSLASGVVSYIGLEWWQDTTKCFLGFVGNKSNKNLSERAKVFKGTIMAFPTSHKSKNNIGAKNREVCSLPPSLHIYELALYFPQVSGQRLYLIGVSHRDMTPIYLWVTRSGIVARVLVVAGYGF